MNTALVCFPGTCKLSYPSSIQGSTTMVVAQSKDIIHAQRQGRERTQPWKPCLVARGPRNLSRSSFAKAVCAQECMRPSFLVSTALQPKQGAPQHPNARSHPLLAPLMRDALWSFAVILNTSSGGESASIFCEMSSPRKTRFSSWVCMCSVLSRHLRARHYH